MVDNPEFICNHRTTEQGELLYQVKWIGYDCEDTTWETEDVVKEEWPELLEAYKKSLKDRLPSKLYDFSSAQNEQNDDFFAYLESIEDWEEAVDKIVYIEKCRLPGFLIYVEWKEGIRSVHHSTQINARCPQKMIDFYERHLTKETILK
ncbi:hypothetical protein G6F49_010731 [Rhizopus delemar]|nr:hypothetical protein G6F43_005818 [Rhizopus delemar]KAG1545648.1 hypothetical protein G6F49_010731 [Rhizopus delemar]KAG1582020.1 hypothetical protein G6F48_009433 [Rhizopus delemar]